jgi:hypothetical protein
MDCDDGRTAGEEPVRRLGAEGGSEPSRASAPQRRRSPVGAAQASLIARRRRLGHLMLLPMHGLGAALMRLAGGYRIAELQRSRDEFARIAATPGPILICANHLTFIDSVIILRALGSPLWYRRNSSRLSWNLPAQDVFGRHWLYRSIGGLSKCLFIDRRGDARHKHAMIRTCSDLIAGGEVVTIFPEGRRSRSGRFEPERLTSGIAHIVAANPHCRVLCLHVRSDRQASYSDFPPRGSVFHVSMQLVEVPAEMPGRTGRRELVARVGETIAALETCFFAGAGRRPG